MLFTSLLSLSAMAATTLASPLPYPFNEFQELARSKIALNERAKGNQAPHTLAVPSEAPHFVIYSDKWIQSGSPPASDLLKGWNTFALCFHLGTSVADMAQGWQSLTADQRSSLKADYGAAGVNLIVSAFGATGTPTSAGVDPAEAATQIAQFVKDYDLDGVDVDYEDFEAFNAGKAEDWLIAFTKAIREKLPSSDNYVVTHAPVAPWFTSNTTTYPNGGYLKVDKEVGDLIDWYNLQFYNQGEEEYTDCETLLNKSIAPWDHSSLFEIVASGVDQNKLVIGKPAAATGDSNNGYMAPADLAKCVAEAKEKSWNGGLMLWQWPDGDSDSWVGSVWGS